MPDWEKLVGERLALLALGERERQEVIAELAGHLEETYERFLRDGLPEREAIHRALSQVPNWNDLQRKIHSAKENRMNSRTSRLWLPSLLTLAASFIALVAFGFLGLPPGPLGSRPHHEEWSSHIIGGIMGGRHLVNEYTVWLMALPFVGALGAGLSRRAGGTRREIIVSGVFPAVAWLTIAIIVLSYAASLGYRDGISNLHTAGALEVVTGPLGPVGLLTVLVLIPGGCLLLGVLVYNAVAKRWTKTAA